MKKTDRLIMGMLTVPGMGKKSVGNFLKEFRLSDETPIDEVIAKIEAFAQKNKRIKAPDRDTFNQYLDLAEKNLVACDAEGIETVSILDPNYPTKFKALDTPPVLLYLKGNKSLLDGFQHIAIIGTREVTDHGRRAGFRLGQLMAEKGEIVVSGLAIGCDTCGHEGCIAAGGKTVAILPSPLTEILPKANRSLAEKILETDGLLLTEYRPGEEVQRGFYVERDRLQSGLSDGIIVVETDVIGGTMHTVEYAKKAGRILACYKRPDNYMGSPQTRGNDKLIEEGDAMPLGSGEEIESFLDAVKEYRQKDRIRHKEEESEQIQMLI